MYFLNLLLSLWRRFSRHFTSAALIFTLILFLQLVLSANNPEDFDEAWEVSKKEDSEVDYNDPGLVEVDALVSFAKSLLNEILHRELPKGQVIDPQKVHYIAKELKQFLDVESNVENLEFHLGQHELCYSYEIVKPDKEERQPVWGCLTPNEIASKLLTVLFSLPKPEKKIRRLSDLPAGRIYCFNADRLHNAIAFSALIGGILWIVLGIFQNSSSMTDFIKKITGVRIIEWFNSPITFLSRPLSSADRQNGAGPTTIVMTTRLRLLIKMMKRDLMGVLKAIKSILMSCIDALLAFYQYLSNHEIFYEVAEIVLWLRRIWKHEERRNRVLSFRVFRALSRTKRYKSKPKSRPMFRPDHYMQQIVDNEAEISSLKSYKTINESVCSSSSFINDLKDEHSSHETSFEILSADEQPTSHATLSDASSDQPIKTQPLSQWDLNTPNLMFEHSPRFYKHDKQTHKPTSSCLSNSSYEVIPTSSTSEKARSGRLVEPEPPCISISTCSSSDEETNKTRSGGCYAEKERSPKQPFHFSTFAPPSMSLTGQCSQLNQNKSGSKLLKNDSSNNRKALYNPWNDTPKPKDQSTNQNRSIWSYQAHAEGSADASKIEANINQLFPKQSTGISGWPTAGEPRQFNTSVWDRNRDVPVLNSLKKSFPTDSSFNFDDSRFNSMSPGGDRFQLGQPLLAFTGMNFMAQEEPALCDFSHILNMQTNIQPNEDVFKPRENIGAGTRKKSRFFNCCEPPSAIQHPHPYQNQGFEAHTGDYRADYPGSKLRPNNKAEKLVQMFKSQRDEINNLRTKIARDSVAISEHQSLLSEVGKDTVEKVQAMHKRSREKLVRAQNEEILRCNALLDKKILKLVNLQRRCNDAKAQEYKLKTEMQWKPYEI